MLREIARSDSTLVMQRRGDDDGTFVYGPSAAVEAGSSAREAARRFEVSPSAAIKLMQRVRATGSAAPA